MNSQNQENTGYSFEASEQFSWQGHQIGEHRFYQIRDSFANLKALCQTHTSDEEPEDTMLLDTMADVLESLERTFLHHFQTKTGHIVSPKSDEPWD